MRKRTLARECALKVLYQMDITNSSIDDLKDTFWSMCAGREISADVKEYFLILIEGVSRNISPIDKKISHYATNWQIKRMAVVDRNILRIGCFELLFRDDIPPKVAINEAVELAKKYSSPEAGKFVNGVLDKVKSEKEKVK